MRRITMQRRIGRAVDHARLPRRSDAPCRDIGMGDASKQDVSALRKTRLNALNMPWRNSKQVPRPADSLAGGRRCAAEHDNSHIWFCRQRERSNQRPPRQPAEGNAGTSHSAAKGGFTI